MLPFGFTTGEAVLYDFSLPNSLSGSDSAAPGNGNQPGPSGDLDPNSLLGSMLKQDKSIYVCPAVPNEPQGCAQELDEEELGGIFSSNMQKSVLSLSENALFIQDPVDHCGSEESGCELLSLMDSLGISPEDLQLLQQDDLFLNIDVDLTDDILSYVQASLRKKEENRLLSGDPQSLAPPLFPLQGRPQELSHDSFTSQSHLPFLSHLQPLPVQEHQQGYLYQPQPCAEPHELSQVTHQGQTFQSVTLQPGHPLNPQQQVPYPVSQRKPEQLYQGPKHVQGNSSGTDGTTVFHPGLQQPGRFYLETTPLGLEVPYRNQMNTVSASCNQDFPCAYIPTGDSRVDEFSSQDLENLLNGLDGVGQQKHGQPGEAQREGNPPNMLS